MDGNNNADVYLVSDDSPKSKYLREIITHAGFIHTQMNPSDLDTISTDGNVILFHGDFKLTKQLSSHIKKLVKKGNSVIFINPKSLPKKIQKLLGVILRDPTDFPFSIGGTKQNSLGEGYLSLTDMKLNEFFNQRIPKEPFPLHGFGCSAIKHCKGVVLAEYTPNTDQSNSYPAIIQNEKGNSSIFLFAPDIVYTTKFIQEGQYVYQDGLPPADGMAPIDDGILKCEDGLVLDWIKDRRTMSKQHSVPAFMIPVVDVWRNLLSKIIEIAADSINAPIQRVKYWPNGSEFVSLISHDTDGNDEEFAKTMLDRINSYNIQTTWCLIPPGYSPELCAEIKNSGHELAFHFDAQTYQLPDIFSFECLKEQFEETTEQTKIYSFFSNKNHYTRWEKRTEFFQWISELGMKVDQSKGPSKCGTIGFPFGTCHPWIPTDNKGNCIDCLEISFQSQDLGLQGPDDIGPEVVDAVKAVNGVVHFIFHPAHSKKKNVAKRLDELIMYVKKQGTLFMRSSDIGKWFYHRRELIQSNNLDLIEKNPKLIIERRNKINQSWEKL